MPTPLTLARSCLGSTRAICRRCHRPLGRNASAAASARRRYHFINDQNLQQLIPSMGDLVLKRDDTIYMAMSGGVDSSVALRILADMPLNIHVFFMRNWDAQLSEAPQDNDVTLDPSFSYNYPSSSVASSSNSIPNPLSPCEWQRDWEAVQRVCDHVGIPRDRVKLVDLSKDYWSRVFEPSIQEWENGGTPNPDVACNREIKFDALIKHIGLPKNRYERERTFLATGHYARMARVPHATRLCRALDHKKDQSYFLSSLKYDQISHAIFPLGELTKPWVRQLAKYYGLPTADKSESMGLCFVGERKRFGSFVSQYVADSDSGGYFVDQDGKILGQHSGLWKWTVGQRTKLPSQPTKLYVAKKQIGRSKLDILLVPWDHPALRCTRLRTRDFHWIEGRPPKGMMPGARKMVQVQIGHRMEEVRGSVGFDWDSKGLILDFDEPLPAVAPGQVCAIWFEQWCLGSGIIEQTWTEDELPADYTKRPGEREEKSSGWIEAARLQKANSLNELEELDNLDQRKQEVVREPSAIVGKVVEKDGFFIHKVGIKEGKRKMLLRQAMREENVLPTEEYDGQFEAMREEKYPHQGLDSAFNLYYEP